ncbi:MAG TPA: acyltransferase [Candidatus Omnitrophota bacterium]|nr:acyltransferase [Candidatus Omnitrophota bacterium]
MSNEASLREIRKFDFVDALRGWAFLAVLLEHVGHRMPLVGFLNSFSDEGGLIGVRLFFIVSAFTLFFSFHIREKDKRNSIKAFFVRRFFRIAPMFWTAIFIYLAIRGFKSLYGAPHEINTWRVLSTLLFMNGWHPNTINNVVPGGWTIAVEMNFYLLLPFFYRHIDSLKKAILCFGFLLAFSFLLKYIYTHLLIPHHLVSKSFVGLLPLWLPSQLPIFSLGFILFFLMRDRLQMQGNHANQTESLKNKFLSIGLVVVFFLTLIPIKIFPAQVLLKDLYPGLGLLCLAWGLALAIYPMPFLVNRFTCYVGKVSFSAYLCHFFIADIVARMLVVLGRKFDLPHWPDVYFVGVFLVTLCWTLCLSTLTYEWIEQPFQNLGKKIIKRYL